MGNSQRMLRPMLEAFSSGFQAPEPPPFAAAPAPKQFPPAPPLQPDEIRETLQYLVRQGDTLEALASKHKVSVDWLKRCNGVHPDTPVYLVPGDTIKVPADTEVSWDDVVIEDASSSKGKGVKKKPMPVEPGPVPEINCMGPNSPHVSPKVENSHKRGGILGPLVQAASGMLQGS